MQTKIIHNKKIIPYEKSFASHPKAQFWSSKNKVKSGEVTISNGNKFLFDCDKCNHTFEMRVSVVKRGCWCNVCSNRVLCKDTKCKMCFNNSFASHEKAQYWSKKNVENPRDVFKSTHKKFLFDCPICKHEIIQDPSHISLGRWCPYCCIPQKKLCGNLECKDCFNKSFASHPKSKYWSKKNKYKPELVLKMGDKRIWFDCDKCGHDFNAQIKNITRGMWCGYCYNKKLCNNNECDVCYNKSFASHPKSKYWSKKNTVLPRDIFKGTHNKYWFNCDKCCHKFIKCVNAITGSKNGWCPYCSNKKMCDNDKCHECFSKSFASHEKVKYWSIKNTANPRQLFQGNSNKYWFNCNVCKSEFYTKLYNIKSGYWCPYCINKTEGKFKKYLENNNSKLFIKKISPKYRPKWANFEKTHNTFYEYDFLITLINNVKIIIEIDGPQHYKQVSNWAIPLYNQIRDRIKELLALKHNINLIRLNQEDIWHDKNEWIDTITQFINRKYKNNEEIEIYDCSEGDRYVENDIVLDNNYVNKIYLDRKELYGKVDGKWVIFNN